MRSAGEGRLHRLGIAQAHRDCDVARDVLVHQRRAWRYRVRRSDDHRQGFVIDRDQLGGVARLRFARGDNDRDPLADIAHPPDRQRRPPGAVTLGAAHVLRHNLRVDCAQPIRSPVLPGQHSEDAGRAGRRRDSDRPDAGMRVWREEEDRIALARQIEVGDIAAAPGKKTEIFLAADRLSDAETAHLSPSRSLRSL